MFALSRKSKLCTLKIQLIMHAYISNYVPQKFSQQCIYISNCRHFNITQEVILKYLCTSQTIQQFILLPVSTMSNKRKSYTIDYKLALLEEAERSTQIEVANKYSITARMLQKWKVQKDAMTEANKQSKRIKGGGRKICLKEDEEDQIFEWRRIKFELLSNCQHF
eukprot:TRINITY_DN2865_c0_g1_i14.p8 TRINITY_DN2865_c0_g1~~TRINITY_DN2865_c0_g1_i14.p8  ORF type:complete len:165 (+),score=0.99 TRINITY_DN2865_c0_g1_i14:3378-3872(+)